MKKFRLKSEAVPFFKEDHATAIYEWTTWDSLGVDKRALEEVEDAYITFGHEKEGSNSSSLSGWNDKGSRFHFTIHLPSVTFREHNHFTNGKIVRDLMNKIQRDVNDFYLSFNNSKK